MPKPTANDIAAAVGIIEADECIDSYLAPIYWSCDLYTPENCLASNGMGDTPGAAMALAWIHLWWPDGIIDCYVPPGEVPWPVPDGWRFELTPPVEIAPLSLSARVKRPR
jgi:hypothetical protein